MDRNEKQFESQVKDLAKTFGWRYYHTWRSIHSEAGFPDCCMVRPPRVIFAELKREGGKPTTYQKDWIDDFTNCPGVESYLWFPSQINKIVEILRGDK